VWDVTVGRASRETYILDLLAKDGSLSVSALSRDLGVSEVTVRGNLRDLGSKGLLTRTHGGAQRTSVVDVLDRQRSRIDEKDRIAAAAADLVVDGDAIMIEAGTTTALVARYLTNKRGVQIVTNSTLVFAYARQNPQLKVILTGGEFHHESESLVGPVALRTLRDFNVRLAFVGTDGFTSHRGMTTQFPQGAEVLAVMRERAEETWLLADSSKYGRAGFVSVLPLSGLAGIITDSGLAPEAAEQLTVTVPDIRIV